jgi:hypothetical protein
MPMMPSAPEAVASTQPVMSYARPPMLYSSIQPFGNTFPGSVTSSLRRISAIGGATVSVGVGEGSDVTAVDVLVGVASS